MNSDENKTKKKKAPAAEQNLFDLPGERKKAAVKSKTQKKTKAGGKKKTGKTEYCWWAAPLMTLSFLIVAFVIMTGFREYIAYASFRDEVSSALNDQFYEGVCVDNYEMTGFGLEDALSAFDSRVENRYRQRSLCFEIGDEGFLITAEELGYASDYDSVIREAWNFGRSGSLEERYRSINQVASNKINYRVNRRLYDPEKLREVTDNVAKSYTREVKNAGVVDFDFATRCFTYADGQTGTYVDAEKLYTDACALIENGGGLLVVDVKTIEPEFSRIDVENKYGMITSAVTNASSSSNNRLINLNLACKAINGTVLEPDAVFSFNEVVGKRTESRGYTVAPVYTNGEVGQDIGGGVCQVSTTLWNAAMKADCEIVERHEHSRPVSYVDKGKDATVSWGSQDMQFKNTTGHTLYIVAYLREDKRVLIEIYGELFPDGNYIKIETKTTRTIKPGDPERIYNPLLSSGEEIVVTEARTGYKAEAYRVYYDKNDTELSRSLLCYSYYKEARAQIEYGR